MDVLTQIKTIISEILDVDINDIQDETFLIRELDAESIDLLELALELGTAFHMDIRDDDLFLRDLRIHIEDAQTKGVAVLDVLKQKIRHIDPRRLAQMLEELPQGPVLKVGDLVRYIEYTKGNAGGN